MIEFRETDPAVMALHKERSDVLVSLNMKDLVIENSGIGPEDKLKFDTGFKGEPEASWFINRSKMRNGSFYSSSNIEIIFDGSILTVRAREIHFKGPIPKDEKDKVEILGEAIRNSFNRW